MEQVILVDEKDNAVGTLEKMEAHQKGLLHRAFSLLIYNSKGEMLLQKRALNKYHSGGLWSNACCSHPRPEESMSDAIQRKLLQEMGITVDTHYSHKFIYRATFGKLTEYECDHIYTGTFDGVPQFNAEEVADWRYMSVNELLLDIDHHPERYSFWFKLIMKQPEVLSISR
jgi:isopentenyl-diphosphate delta-isomerase